MTLKGYLSVMITLTLICWGIFLFVANLVDPSSTNWFGFILFYLSLFIASSGLIALLGFVIRFFAFKKELTFYLVKISFRQSFIFSFFIVLILFLQAHHLLNILNIILLIIIFSILEVFLVSYKKNH